MQTSSNLIKLHQAASQPLSNSHIDSIGTSGEVPPGCQRSVVQYEVKAHTARAGLQIVRSLGRDARRIPVPVRNSPAALSSWLPSRASGLGNMLIDLASPVGSFFIQIANSHY